MPEDTLTASSDCPAGTTISVYHMEAGEYMLEFEGEDVESFKMAIAQMMGAHHHHHDHGDHGDEDHDDMTIMMMTVKTTMTMTIMMMTVKTTMTMTSMMDMMTMMKNSTLTKPYRSGILTTTASFLGKNSLKVWNQWKMNTMTMMTMGMNTMPATIH